MRTATFVGTAALLTAAIALITATASAPAAPVPAPPGRVSAECIAAWREAGAEVRFVTTAGLWAEAPTPGCRAAFRFHGWVPGRFGRLPAPGGPFALDVSFPWPGDERQGVAWQITDGGLADLVRFQNLRSLHVFGRDITDAGADHIAKLANLERLWLSCAKVTPAGLRELARLPKLERLMLSSMDVTEPMLKEVAEFGGLVRLDLSHTGSEITATGLRHLAGMPRLVALDFFGVNVGDRAARELGESRSLKRIDFLNTSVTENGAAELRGLLPGCEATARTVDLTPPPPMLPPAAGKK